MLQNVGEHQYPNSTTPHWELSILFAKKKTKRLLPRDARSDVEPRIRELLPRDDRIGVDPPNYTLGQQPSYDVNRIE